MIEHARRIADRRREAIALATREVDELSEEAMLADAATLVWKAARFDGRPSFYPVYRHGDLYSHSPLNLVLLKGRYRFDPSLLSRVGPGGLSMLPNSAPVDLDLVRVGGPRPVGEGSITEERDYAVRLAGALRRDVAAAEDINGARNVVLCGGKDSLNLLLLPWSNPVIAVSAQPNTPLVRAFVDANGLGIEVRELEDRRDEAVLAEEAMENLGRVDLVNWRWTAHLREIAAEMPSQFWKGQLGDLVMSDFWKMYRAQPETDRALPRRVHKKAARFLPSAIDRPLARRSLRGLGEAMWARAARGQGDHVGFVRALTGSVVRSAYHGEAVAAVWHDADLTRVAKRDMRHLIGEALLGRPVRYPAENPAPAPSAMREGLCRPEVYVPLLEAAGVEVEAA